MTNSMTNLTQRNLTAPVNTIVHLGAGSCREFESYLSRQPSRLVLVDADAACADKLRDRAGELSNVDVLNKAVAGESRGAVLQCFNQTSVNSLHTPGPALHKIYPGLRIIEKRMVDTISAADLVRPLDINADQNNWLIVDVAGEEMSILNSLAESSQLEHFHSIRLYSSQYPLYENAEPADVILDWLKNRGFDTISELRDPDIDSTAWDLQIDHSRLDIKKLNSQVVALHTQIEVLSKKHGEAVDLIGERETQIQQLTQLSNTHAEEAVKIKKELLILKESTTSLENLLSKKDQDIRTLKQDSEEQLEIVKQRNSQIELLKSTKKETTQKLISIQKDLTTIQEKLADQKRTNSKQKQEIESLKQSRTKQTELTNSLQSQLDKLIKAKEAATQKEMFLEQELSQLKQALVTNKESSSEQKKEIETLKHSQVKQAELTNDQYSQIRLLTKAKNDAIQKVKTLENELGQLQQTVANHEKLKSTQSREIEKLTKSQSKQTLLANERQAKVDQLTKEKEKSEQHAATYKLQMDERTKELHDQMDLLEQKQQIITDLESRVDELDMRDVLVRQEISKAEAQIEVFKELLLK